MILGVNPCRVGGL